MTYGHLQADCLYTGISSGPNARYRVWEAFTFTFLSYRKAVSRVCLRNFTFWLSLLTAVQAGEGEWLLLRNDDVIKNDGSETANCDQLLLDVRFEPDSGKYTLPYPDTARVYTRTALLTASLIK